MRLQLVVSEAPQTDEDCVRVLLTPSPTVLQRTPMRHLHHRIPSGTPSIYFEQCATVTLSLPQMLVWKTWQPRCQGLVQLARTGAPLQTPHVPSMRLVRERCSTSLFGFYTECILPQELWLKNGPPRLHVCAAHHRLDTCPTGDCGQSSSKVATTADRS